MFARILRQDAKVCNESLASCGLFFVAADFSVYPRNREDFFGALWRCLIYLFHIDAE